MTKSVQVTRFREARHLAKVFPDRFKLKAKIVDGNFLWACFEYRDYAAKPVLFSESHEGLVAHGWNKSLYMVNDYSRGCFEFIIISYEEDNES